MKFFRSNGDRVPSHIEAMAKEAKSGEVDRREFLAMASIFGASTAMAYGMAGRWWKAVRIPNCRPRRWPRSRRREA